MKRLKTTLLVVVAIILLITLVFTSVAYAVTLQQKQAETSEIKSELVITQDARKALHKRVKQLEKENANLKAKRQAKLEAARQSTYNPSIEIVAVSGTCREWLAKAGVTDINNAMWLINKESGCNPRAVNPTSGAYGIPQSLPASKMASAGSDWETNPVTQIKWMQSYIMARYGSWSAAVEFHKTHNWY